MMHLTDWWYSSFGQSETDESKAIKTVLDKIEQSLGMFAMEQDRWIPVTERLPEEDGRYLITEKTDGTKVQEGYFCRTRDGEPYWWYLHVVAWRPLPEPYTEDEA